MPKVRAGSSAKWGTNSSKSGDFYKQGIQSPRNDWAKATLAAEANQAAGAQLAITQKLFSKGVAKAGSAKWLKGATEKGVSRFTTGVQQAQDEYDAAIKPYFAVIEATTLPPRYPKGDPRNLARVQVMADALHKKKISG